MTGSEIIYKFTPLRQAGLSALIALAGIIVCHFALKGLAYEFMASFTGIVLFSMANCFVSVFHADFSKYTLPSWAVFVALVALLLLCARYISGISIWTLSAYRMMLLSVLIFYFVASLLVRLIRLIWEFAEADEN